MHIVIQAGGRGNRMGPYTANKPKALVSINNLPIIFHLFNQFPYENFIIIGDYKKKALTNYLDMGSKTGKIKVDYEIVDGSDGLHTCAGLRHALEKVPADEQFMIIWCDLILPHDLIIPIDGKNHIGISQDLDCRWAYNGISFKEERILGMGVAGMFIFKNKNELAGVPSTGEFVKWLGTRGLEFDVLDITGAIEYGEWEKVPKPEEGSCRPFNRTEIIGDRFIKHAIDEKGMELAVREKAWYRHMMKRKYSHIPKIHECSPSKPLEMELVNGQNVYRYTFSIAEKEIVLEKIVNNLLSLHEMETVDTYKPSMMHAYYHKTIERLGDVSAMIPFADQKTIWVNGLECRNIFFHMDEVLAKIDQIQCPRFCLIHGDCTFSNIMLKDNVDPVFIDPRGYFGHTELYGDPSYDWVKLYYSLFGNYDKFNLRKFTLNIDEDSMEVKLDIKSNGWECMEDKFLEMVSKDVDANTLGLMHAMVWLSLTTYAWDDYDSICGAFYNGLYHLECYFRKIEE